MNKDIISNIPDLKRKSYQEFAGPCLWCGGEDRFLVWPQQGCGGRFYCRQCQRKGDLIDIYRMQGMSFRQAKGMVVGLPESPSQIQLEKTRPKPTNQTWRLKAEKFIKNAAQSKAPAFKNLLHSRCIKFETAQKLKIGWNESDLILRAEDWGLEGKELFIPAGLIIPIFRKSGVVGVKIRKNKPDNKGKYSQIRGGLPNCTLLGKVGKATVIVESELDAILLFQEASDLITSVALGGAHNNLDHDTVILLEASNRILVATDFDTPKESDKIGVGQRTFLRLKTKFPKAEFFPPAIGKDPTEMHCNGISVRDWIKCAFTNKENLPTSNTLIPHSYPHEHENLLKLLIQHRNLVPCPIAKNPWYWISRETCKSCDGHIHCIKEIFDLHKNPN